MRLDSFYVKNLSTMGYIFLKIMWIGVILLEDTAENWVGEEKIVKKWFKNASREVEKIKFSYPGEEDTPSPGPYPPQPRASIHHPPCTPIEVLCS